ncbi:hypothetical protein [Halioxenophilus sp. WMMB6]|uniref:hypothetical protein n=1 Tax=Halioxenophilus sp. WMMB6 TaxID=3073815 RepID=UPI00295ECE68|nr:hypothetical protein [Halioxenophilus sp. WMMB6]
MKRPKTKAEVRAEINQQVSEFLQSGGQVSEHQQGESSRAFALHPFKAQSVDKPSETRTPVPDAIAAIESRRKPAAKEKAPPRRKPRKVLIKDDFGQPLRWVWEE